MSAIHSASTSPRREQGPDDTLSLTETEFRRVAALADRVAGLSIPESKRTMVQSRLVRRLRARGMANFATYLALFDGPGGKEEMPHLISALTTNVSHFFREEHHFDTLRKVLLPQLIDRARQGKRVRIWSAGCSSGQEPYSIAMSVLGAEREIARYDFRILATDIDLAILERARSGMYAEAQLEGLPPEALKTWTAPSADGTGRRISDSARALVSFRQLNLVDPWPMSGLFDVVFCRNVVIYFSEETQRRLWPRFAEVLQPNGWLFLGHSERMQDPAGAGFISTGVTSYQRLAQTELQKEIS